jgi:hypothetical protein
MFLLVTKKNSILNCTLIQGILFERGRDRTVDLLIKVACFVTKREKYFQFKKKLVSTRR